MKTRVLAAACVLVLTGAGAAAADPGPESPTVEPGTAAGSSEEITPGHYRFDLPDDSTERYLQLSRKAAESIVLSAYTVPSAAEDSIHLALVLPDGETECGTDTDSKSAESAGHPLHAAVALDPDKSARTEAASVGEGCTSAKKVMLQISRRNSTETGGSKKKALPVELTYSKEPAAQGGGDRPSTKSDVAAKPIPIKNDSTVKPGSTPHTAAPLENDTGTRVSVKPGTTAYYKVRVGWNQRLHAAAQAPEPGSGYKPQASVDVALGILSPQGIPAAAGDENTASFSTGLDADPQRMFAFTAPVRHANRDASPSASTGSDGEAVQWTTQPGWYVVALRAEPDIGASVPKNAKPVPALLTVKTTGKATTGPTYTVDGQSVAAPQAGHMSGPGDSSGVLSMVVKVGVTLIILVAAGAALMWMWRGSRR